MKIYMLLIMFLLLGAFFVISENNLALSNSEDRARFVGLYFGWMSSVFDNTKQIIGNVIKLDWLPKSNSSD